jgi:Fe-S oxidoreductase
MKGDGKPVSFIEDCAVPLEHLATYTASVTELFERHGTRGTWYAHASVGCLHVRPILNMKSPDDVARMRAIAEEAAELVRRFEGSFSGEHGDGISRSEFIAPMFGERLTRAFGEVKAAFDPGLHLNPGKIVEPYRMDDRDLMRFGPDYAVAEPAQPALDWSDWGGFGRATEMCNNNGACRKLSGGSMCPSYRVTRDETHVTRGRANSLRLALSGQLGPDALTSPAMDEAMSLCVACKACKRECPTGVDMARMKAEYLHQRRLKHGMRLGDHLIAHLPRYARVAAALAPLMNLRDRLPGLAWLSEKLLGFERTRRLPAWRRPWAAPAAMAPGAGDARRQLVLFADTFNRYFEPDNLDAALQVLSAGGYKVHVAKPPDGGRALCCGRTFLSNGYAEEARAEVRRSFEALEPFVARGARVVVLEPSCLSMLKDDAHALLPGAAATAIADAAFSLEEVLARDAADGTLTLRFRPQGGRVAHLHGHCHQKAMGGMDAARACLSLVPGLEIREIDAACCGMAGAFGYRASTYDVSRRMAENGLLPAVRLAGDGDAVIASGTSCRHQIADLSGASPQHAVRILADALEPAPDGRNHSGT